MAHPILMPKPGQMTEECVLTVWHKEEGDPVARGDVLFEIETDKSIMDVESFETGVLLKRLVAEGDTVPVNAVCAWVGEPGEAVPEELPTQVAVTAPAPSSTPAEVAVAAQAAAVAQANIQVAIRTECYLAAVMIGIRLVDFQNNNLALGSSYNGICMVEAKTRYN